MCLDPVSLLGVAGKAGGTVLSGVSTAVSVVSGVLGAYSQYQNARVQAQVARNNAVAADNAALEAIEQGREESDLIRRRAARFQGQQAVAMAANGVDVTSDNAIGLLGETLMLSEEDAFATRENALSRAEDFAQQSANFRADAATADSAAFFQPIQTILGTASKVGRRYSNMVEYA